MRKSAQYFKLFVLLLIFVSYSTAAQVPVREEPRHKVVLENEYIRLIDVHIPPGDTTLYHIHATPSVIIGLTKAITGSQLLGEKPSAPGQTIPGNTWFAPYKEKPITHRVFNAGKDTFHVMDIELVKEKMYADSFSIPVQDNIDLLWEEKLVRLYKISMEPGKQYNFQQNNCAHLLVNISGTTQTSAANGQHTIQSGEFIFFGSQRNFQIDNKGNNNAECVVLELK